MTPKPITATANRSKRRYWIGSDRRYDRYNRSLVNRIEDLLDPSFLMNWKMYWVRSDSDRMSMEKHLYRGRVKGGGVINLSPVHEVKVWQARAHTGPKKRRQGL